MLSAEKDHYFGSALRKFRLVTILPKCDSILPNGNIWVSVNSISIKVNSFLINQLLLPGY